MRVFRHLLYQGIVNLGRNKWAQVFTVSAVTFVAFLAGLFLLLLFNFNLAVRSTQDGIQYQVYWQSGYSMDEINSQWNDIRTWEIESIRTYTPDEALQGLVDSMSGDYDPGHLSKNNPLPATAVVEFSLDTEQGEDLAQEILSRLEQLSGVERVSYNPMQMDMARTWLAVTSKVFWPLIAFMFLITGLVVANTLKLNQINRRDEVEILSLVGASSIYIKFPLLITGALQGLIGGVFSVLLLKTVHLLIKDILNFPPIWVSIEFLPPLYTGIFVAALVGVGIMSSFLTGKDQVRQV
ncbi:MAG: FtsX-like permease family protein [Desulfonatronovibrio sp. MSAO_Bac4]|nr:MAG: FtsX-like permease family protein [Desulfonatronovibrio sp. MSAO_Bac4]